MGEPRFAEIRAVDPEMHALIRGEYRRQDITLMMIASENHPSRAVEQAQSSRLGSKYAEGYPRLRYYQGQEFANAVESLAQQRARELFRVPHANVQPYSGSPANVETLLALAEPGDTIMGLSLNAGGHLTHGARVSATSRIFNSVNYDVTPEGLIDYDKLADLAQQHRPKVIIAGTTAYARILRWGKFAEIADGVGAFLMADIAHVAGLVAGEAYPSPVPYADVVTTTTHKTLRGPRGAMIMVTEKGLGKDEELGAKVDKTVFPGMQGGPHLHTIAAIGIALKEASTGAFKVYANNVVVNANNLGAELQDEGFKLVTGGTDSHLLLIDVTSKRITGRIYAEALEEVGIVVNYNAIPFDTRPPLHPSGLRVGTAAITSREMDFRDMTQIAQWMGSVAEQVEFAQITQEVTERDLRQRRTRLEVIASMPDARKIRREVEELARNHPIPTRYI